MWLLLTLANERLMLRMRPAGAGGFKPDTFPSVFVVFADGKTARSLRQLRSRHPELSFNDVKVHTFCILPNKLCLRGF